MIIDFIIGEEPPLFDVIRDDEGKVVQIDIDYRLTLLQIHCSAKKELTVDEFQRYLEIMMPKPACEHLTIEYTATHGYLKAI